MDRITAELFSRRDEKYAAFSESLTPCDYGFIGVRIPELRKIAKRAASECAEEYLESWEYRYFEDLMLRGLVISYVKTDYDERMRLFSSFIPMIDNWSVCDTFCSAWKPGKKERRAYWDFIAGYLGTGKEFQMRYSVVSMMKNYLTDGCFGRVISEIDKTADSGYYYGTGAAWCLAECVARHPDETMDYLRGNTGLDNFIYRRALQKSLESFRVSDSLKEEIRRMRSQIDDGGIQSSS